MDINFKPLPKDKRKKILLLCDDIRVHSGVATIAREIVLHTCHHFNFAQIAGAIQHPDKGKRFDLSEDTNKQAGIKDSSVVLYPTDGYGSPELLRQVIQVEKPDALFLITDPRYFEYVFQMENEIRRKIPIIYLNIWDDYPAPLYNSAFYESCDALLGISKQTVNINKIVLGEKKKNKIIEYVPHGLNHEIYFPISKDSNENKGIEEIKKAIFGDREIDFLMFFNSRNIRRKQIPDSMMAFRLFLDSLPKEKADKCAFLLHTDISSEHGTNLESVRELLFEEKYPNAIYFSQNKISASDLNKLYNLSDVQILLTSNEGWGLTLTESMLAGTPFIANVTGGMQDQMRFEDGDGKWIEFDKSFPSNHLGTYKKHGEWAFPVYPTSRSLQGSPKTPYIWDDRCTAEDAAKQIIKVYNLDPEKRKERGMKGREWALSDEAGFTGKKMAKRVIEHVDKLFDTWEPRENFEIINTSIDTRKIQTHNLVY